MINKKLMIFIIFLVSLLAISSVSAADNAKNYIVSAEETTDEIISIEDSQIILKENNAGTFAELNTTINGNTESEICLNKDYYYDNSSDGDFKSGISINRPVTIYGNGFIISGENTARILNVNNENVVLQGITFINGKITGNGGAIYGYSTAINCTFINNSANGRGYAKGDGGAIYGSAAYNCTFINNYAEDSGGAFCEIANLNGAAAYNCIFINNSAKNAGAIFECDAYNCTFINNSANSQGGAIFWCDAYNCIFINNSAFYGGAIRSGAFYNCIFINNHAYSGGASYWCDAYNCIFINNHADGSSGGATLMSNAYNCTFINNTAKSNGGAMDSGSANYCIFNGNIAGKEGNDTYNTKFGTTLTVPDVVTVYNTAGKVVATLKDTCGNVVSGIYVKIVVGSLSKTAKTNKNGQVSIDISSLEPGEYQISARSSAKSKIYDEAKTTAKAIVSEDKIDTTLTVPDVVTIYGTPSSVVATLKDSYGNLVSGINVRIVVGSLSITAKTDANGQVSLDISDLAPGEYQISARSSAKSKIYNEVKTTAKAIISVDKIDTTLTIPDVIAVGDSPAVVVATLKDSLGNVVSGLNVKIVVGGLSKVAKTDANGQVSLDISSLAPGEYKISARSSATSNIYKEAKTTAKAIISEDKLDTTLTIPDVVVDGTSSGIVVATLKDSYGNAVSGINVKIVAGSLSKTAKTNKNGRVSLDISSLAPGEYKISARSSGTSAIYKEAKATAKAIVYEN